MESFGPNMDVQEKMVCIPAGTFLYGDGKEKRELSEFWLGRAPVTNGEYANFVATTDNEPPEHWGGKVPPTHISDHPVTHVSWYEAMAYVEWVGKRLPSETHKMVWIYGGRSTRNRWPE
jgi:formylglycine-generating enzyme required for sulfatase activity